MHVYFCLMESGKYFLYNEKIFTKGKLIISADNRSFRFGDGFFETMKMIKGNIVLSDYHFQRLLSSLQLLKFEKPDYFNTAYLLNQTKKIALKNQHSESARIRLIVFRSDGGLYDYENNFPNYIIQTWKSDPQISTLNKKGLITGIYNKARKTCDDFSHIKSNNYLPYVMAAMWAKENKMDDALILNNYNRIAEATIANLFIVKNGKIKTPVLSEGCVNGVMRRFLIECLQKENIPFEETQIETDEIAEANELFLTNAVQGIKWVKKCDKYNYSSELAEYLYNKFLL
ncbi:MAG TPA: aminotransferase class IV [Parafilimonas sp.]